jgi:hypothetical protein
MKLIRSSSCHVGSARKLSHWRPGQAKTGWAGTNMTHLFSFLSLLFRLQLTTCSCPAMGAEQPSATLAMPCACNLMAWGSPCSQVSPQIASPHNDHSQWPLLSVNLVPFCALRNGNKSHECCMAPGDFSPTTTLGYYRLLLCINGREVFISDTP